MIEKIAGRMEIIAEMLDLEMREAFDIAEDAFNPYKFTNAGLLDCQHDPRFDRLAELVMGTKAIIKRPKVPAVDEPATEICTSEREDYEEANDTLRHGNALMQQEILELKARLYDLLVERIWDKL